MDAALAAAVDRAAADAATAARVLVAYSGGLDSTALLHALHAHTTLPLAALHVNHQLHPDADRWQRHCEQQCDAWGIPITTLRAEVKAQGHGLEAAARDVRYACFEAELHKDEVLVLAQHQDDQAETLLLRLLRGAGREGLAAMAPRRRLGHGWLLRPLLDVPRSSLEAYAGDAQLQWVEDGSNSDLRFDRNYLRRDVMPRLEHRWPAYRDTLARAARQLRESAQRPGESPPPLIFSPVGDPGFCTTELPSEGTQVSAAIRAWLRDRGLAMPSRAQLESFREQLAHGEGAQLATSRWILERYRDDVFCRLPLPDMPPATRSLSLALGERRDIEGVGVLTLAFTSETAPAGASARYDVRFRGGSERLALADGSHSTLKTLFQSLGIPRWWRPRVPLLYSEEELLTVGPFRRSALPQAASLQLCWEPPVVPVRRSLD